MDLVEVTRDDKLKEGPQREVRPVFCIIIHVHVIFQSEEQTLQSFTNNLCKVSYFALSDFDYDCAL